METKSGQEEELDKAPILGSWNAIYAFVLIFFVVLVGLFYWFTEAYN